MKLTNLQQQLAQEISEIISIHFAQEKQETQEKQEAQFLKPQHQDQGDFSTPVSLKIAKQTKQNPLEVAKNIAAEIKPNPYIEKVEIAAPGFINFFLAKTFLLENLQDHQLLNQSTQKETIIVDYSSPNIAKPLGIHHILSTVIGQAAVNLNRAQGHQVIAWNYLGDWGTQFGKLIYAYKNWGDKATIEQDPINELLKLYVEFHNQAETNPELEAHGRQEFKKLEQGDTENRQLWTWIVELSKQDLEKVYQKLHGIHCDIFSGEADREPDLPKIIQEGLTQKVFTKGENNSLIVDLEDQKMIPFLVQKSDGATLYSTRDIASIKLRLANHQATKLIYVVDVAQSLHFQQLFATVKKFDWFKTSNQTTEQNRQIQGAQSKAVEQTSTETIKNKQATPELIHLKFGRMSFKDGKMSTRKGNIIHLQDLIDEAIHRAKKIILEKNPNLENLDQVAEIIGVGSIKYSVLSQSPETNIVFDWDKIISFEGNAAPYLQYSYARANSIVNQAEKPQATTTNFDQTKLTFQPEETALLKHITQFADAVEDSATKLKPHLLANYLFELCQNFNSFYTQCPVLNCPDPDTRNFRLALSTKFCQILKEGLNLLAGIQVPEKM